MRTYRTVSATASVGTFISTAAWGASRIITAVSTTATAENSLICPATTRPARSLSPAPTALPSSTVTPMVSPVTTTVADCITWLPVATADTLAVGENRPTTARSTPPYRAWSSRDIISGSANRIRVGRMGPVRNALRCPSSFSVINSILLSRYPYKEKSPTSIHLLAIMYQTKRPRRSLYCSRLPSNVNLLPDFLFSSLLTA